MLGRSTALRPPDERQERLALIRHHLSSVSDNDKIALLAEFAIDNGGPDMIVKVASLLLGGVAVIGSRMPSIYRVVFAQAINKEAEKLAFPAECDETRH